MKIGEKSLLILIFVTTLLFLGFTKKKPTSEYAPILENGYDNEEAFDTMMEVISHPRCINCHPNDGVPKRGMISTPHPFGMEGMESNLSYEAL